MTNGERPHWSSRRGVLSAFAGTGVAAALGGIASRRGDAGATDSIDEILLGSFESTLDGWGADDDVALSRIAHDDRPVAVTEGEYALDVTVDGDSAPAISRSVTDLEFSAHPYFVADVVPGRVDGTDAGVAFRFRLYGPADLFDGSSEELIAESVPVTVPQVTPGRIYWDASDVESERLDAASRLEIGWHPAGRDPESDDEFEYDGRVAVDAVRAIDSVDPVGGARLAAAMRDLQFEHGAYVRTEVLEPFDGGEEGAFVFADGATEPYRFEVLDADRFLLTVAGDEIEFGGGWS